MKNEAFDKILNDELRNHLALNEKVVWEGRPYLSYGDKIIYGFECLVFVLIILYFLKKRI